MGEPSPSSIAPEEVVYSVRATFAEASVAEEWCRWLMDGHAALVVQGGATTWELLSVNGASCVREIRYRFPSLQALQRYERKTAPALREDGLRRFPAARGVTLERSVSALLAVPGRAAIR